MMDADYRSIEDILHKGVFNVPVYQRPYSWDYKIVNVLLEDLWDTFQSNDKEDGYYIGNIMIDDTHKKLSGFSLYDVIDGQQRITTISIVMMVLYCNLFEAGCKKENFHFLKLMNCLWKMSNTDWDMNTRAIRLNSVEKQIFIELYDCCFLTPNKVSEFCTNILKNNPYVVQKRIIDNFVRINGFFSEKFEKQDLNTLLNFTKFLLEKVYFVVIDAKDTSRKRMFSIFESINGKGKKLEEIDLIKSYIFSKLEEEDYDEYLNIWGELIISTHDNLSDYLYTYIRAYIFYYRRSINKDIFQTLGGHFINLFGVSNLRDALKALLKDLQEKVKFYNALRDVDLAYDIIKYDKIRFLWSIFTRIVYEHPKPLYFRLLVEYSKGKIEKEDVFVIVKESLAFMIKFLSLGDRDSKDALPLFSNIMTNIKENGVVKEDTKKNIVDLIANELYDKGIADDFIKESITTKDFFDKNKNLGLAFLSLYQSINQYGKISYDKAYKYMEDYGTVYNIDHLLPQTPEEWCTYDKNKISESVSELILREGHDFPDEIKNGMDYDTFESKCLNKIGNLRIVYRSENSTKSNSKIAEVERYGEFVKYAQISKRGEEIATFIVENFVKNPPENLDYNVKKRKHQTNNMRMKDLIELGLVKIGDELYLKVGLDDNSARLISSNEVEYKGKKYTINSWAQAITGWKSVNIYEYVCVVGETESLNDKRMKLQEGRLFL